MVNKDKILVGILMGSASDAETMAETEKILKENKVSYEINILSAHRNPDEVSKYAKAAEKMGRCRRHQCAERPARVNWRGLALPGLFY